MLTRLLVCNTSYLNTVKPVYKGHSMAPENVPFMSSCWNIVFITALALFRAILLSVLLFCILYSYVSLTVSHTKY
jgi:hypothetical protein